MRRGLGLPVGRPVVRTLLPRPLDDRALTAHGFTRTERTNAHVKVITWLPRFATTRTGTLTLRTTSRKPVSIDGLLVRHR